MLVDFCVVFKRKLINNITNPILWSVVKFDFNGHAKFWICAVKLNSKFQSHDIWIQKWWYLKCQIYITDAVDKRRSIVKIVVAFWYLLAELKIYSACRAYYRFSVNFRLHREYRNVASIYIRYLSKTELIGNIYDFQSMFIIF